MPHIVLLEEAMEELQAKSAAPPTAAQSALMAALNDADAYAHGSNPDAEILEAIEELAGSIKGYLAAYAQPSDVRLQAYSDQLNSIVP